MSHYALIFAVGWVYVKHFSIIMESPFELLVIPLSILVKQLWQFVWLKALNFQKLDCSLGLSQVNVACMQNLQWAA